LFNINAVVQMPPKPHRASISEEKTKICEELVKYFLGENT